VKKSISNSTPIGQTGPESAPHSDWLLDHYFYGKRVVGGVARGDFAILGESSENALAQDTIAASRHFVSRASSDDILGRGQTPDRLTLAPIPGERSGQMLLRTKTMGEPGRGQVPQTHVVLIPSNLAALLKNNSWAVADRLMRQEFGLPSFEDAGQPAKSLPLLIMPSGELMSQLRRSSEALHGEGLLLALSTLDIVWAGRFASLPASLPASKRVGLLQAITALLPVPMRSRLASATGALGADSAVLQIGFGGGNSNSLRVGEDGTIGDPGVDDLAKSYSRILDELIQKGLTLDEVIGTLDSWSPKCPSSFSPAGSATLAPLLEEELYVRAGERVVTLKPPRQMKSLVASRHIRNREASDGELAWAVEQVFRTSAAAGSLTSMGPTMGEIAGACGRLDGISMEGVLADEGQWSNCEALSKDWALIDELVERLIPAVNGPTNQGSLLDFAYRVADRAFRIQVKDLDDLQDIHQQFSDSFLMGDFDSHHRGQLAEWMLFKSLPKILSEAPDELRIGPWSRTLSRYQKASAPWFNRTLNTDWARGVVETQFQANPSLGRLILSIAAPDSLEPGVIEKAIQLCDVSLWAQIVFPWISLAESQDHFGFDDNSIASELARIHVNDLSALPLNLRSKVVGSMALNDRVAIAVQELANGEMDASDVFRYCRFDLLEDSRLANSKERAGLESALYKSEDCMPALKKIAGLDLIGKTANTIPIDQVLTILENYFDYLDDMKYHRGRQAAAEKNHSDVTAMYVRCLVNCGDVQLIKEKASKLKTEIGKSGDVAWYTSMLRRRLVGLVSDSGSVDAAAIFHVLRSFGEHLSRAEAQYAVETILEQETGLQPVGGASANALTRLGRTLTELEQIGFSEELGAFSAALVEQAAPTDWPAEYVHRSVRSTHEGLLALGAIDARVVKPTRDSLPGSKGRGERSGIGDPASLATDITQLSLLLQRGKLGSRLRQLSRSLEAITVDQVRPKKRRGVPFFRRADPQEQSGEAEDPRRQKAKRKTDQIDR